MKILITYYSRTKTTKRVCEVLAEKLGADIEEIIDTKNRDGIKGYISAGKDAMRDEMTKLEDLKKDPADYDLLIIGTPVWAWKPAVPVSTFISNYKEKLNKVAFVITQGAKPPKQVEIFSMLETISEKKSIANLHLSTAQVKKDEFKSEIEDFIKALNA